MGTVVLPELSLVIKKAEGENEIEINYTVMSEEEFVFRVDQDEAGSEIYNALEDDEEFLKVKKEYARILYDDKED